MATIHNDVVEFLSLVRDGLNEGMASCWREIELGGSVNIGFDPLILPREVYVTTGFSMPKKGYLVGKHIPLSIYFKKS